MEENPLKTERADYIKCRGCGANMEFDPESQMLICKHCGAKVDFEKDKQVEEINIEKAFSSKPLYDKETTLYRCANCGAQVAIRSDEVATECPFCSTPYTVKTEKLPGLKPNAVYPFKIGQDRALEIVKKQIRKKFFCPRKFKKNLDPNAVKGVYVPCFTFDSNTSSTYSGRIGIRHTRTVRTGNGTRTETYYTYRNISGNLSHFFDDITITAGKKINQSVLDKIMPYNPNDLCAYESKYLSGFYAAHYERDVKNCWNEAKSKMDSLIKNLILSQYSYDTVEYLNVSTIHNDVTYKYVLMPIYKMSFPYRKKEYGVIINGTTGKAKGKLPISPLKAFLVGLCGVGVIALFVFLYLHYFS